jgi:dihydrofolate synthase
LLTATAFKVFEDEKIDAGIVEVGMGGRNDATNVLKHKSLTVISHIGFDHQDFLGNTLEEITEEKCGIFARGVPIIYDDTNEPEVLKEIRRQSYRRFANVLHDSNFNYFPKSGPTRVAWVEDCFVDAFGSSSFQLQNAKLAYHSAFVFLASMGLNPNRTLLADAIAATKINGRLQIVDLYNIVGRHVDALLDGAHNPQAIEIVDRFIRERFRTSGPVSWVLAFSEGKPLDQMLRPLLESGDSVAAVEFGPVDGMPWKQAMPSSQIRDYLRSLPADTCEVKVKNFGPRVRDALQWAADQNPNSTSIAILGSLYLVSDVLRMNRDIENSRKETIDESSKES